MHEKKKPVYIGTCGHEYDDEWHRDDRSSYTVLDEPSGAYVIVTTCEACWKENSDSGRIVDDSEIPLDMSNPFENDPAPDVMITIDENGEAVLVDFTE